MTTAAFARHAGVTRITLHKVLTGERWQYITVDFALAVCDASNGEIEPSDFHSLTAVTAEEGSGPSKQKRTGTDG